MLMLERRQAHLDQAQIARHAQMADQRADLGVDQQILGPPLDTDNALPGKTHVEVFRNRPA
ncbi:hypothetical protein D3C80_1700160 [compost metagenome]